jgi:tRNA pseudouridine55 synthase
MTDGVLVIDKPSGMTSHDVVDEIRRRFKTKKVGHAGTLDPEATGVLLVGLGRATRFLSYAQDAPKRYAAGARFGITTTTQDAWGETVSERSCSFTRDDLLVALEKLTGGIEQVPPMVSAVKVGGRRLHESARRGEEVDRPARPVTVYELTLTSFTAGERPEAELDVLCSSGTFVRTLIHDAGELLGCGAHMTKLRRTETGGFTIGDATPLADIGAAALKPLADVVRVLPAIDVSADDAAAVGYGRKLPATRAPDAAEGSTMALVCDGHLIAVYRRVGDELAADRVVPS